MTASKSIRNWIVLFLLIAFILIGYIYLYQDHRNIQAEQPNFIVTSSFISSEFSNKLLESETKYLNKTIEVSGIISEINQNNLTLDDQVFCQLSETMPLSIKINSEIKIKGRLIGYDDLLEQVKLDQCFILNN